MVVPVVPAVSTRPPPLDEDEDEAWSAADATRSSHVGAADEHGIVLVPVRVGGRGAREMS
jgi:hypothetical protein